MATGLIGGQLNYLSARVEFQLDRPESGFAALSAALDFARTGSKWMFQIGLADQWYHDGLSPRIAMSLYDNLLRDPQPADWSFDPFESLTVLAIPHRGVFEHWFDAAPEAEGGREGGRNCRSCPAPHVSQLADYGRPAPGAPLDPRDTPNRTRQACRTATSRPAGPVSGV